LSRLTLARSKDNVVGVRAQKDTRDRQQGDQRSRAAHRVKCSAKRARLEQGAG
jgi:hypothetical protein